MSGTAELLTDSHVHFDAFIASGEVTAVLERAAGAGVQRMVAIGGTTQANRDAVALAKEHAGRIWAVVGFDRDEAEREPPVDEVDALMEQPGVVAVGETGLDYHYSPETAVAQKKLFTSMLELASRHGVPTVIHSRDADDDTAGILSDFQKMAADPLRLGVLHCFTGSVTFAKRLLDLGLMISVSGIVTFKNAEELRAVARYVPDDRLLIETDAPYLAPVPYRGKRNEPAYVRYVAEALAQTRGVPLQHLCELTSANAARLFRLDEN
jgi:TatD DNase family protein